MAHSLHGLLILSLLQFSLRLACFPLLELSSDVLCVSDCFVRAHVNVLGLLLAEQSDLFACFGQSISQCLEGFSVRIFFTKCCEVRCVAILHHSVICVEYTRSAADSCYAVNISQLANNTYFFQLYDSQLIDTSFH